jgi:prevent-host-death family protein
MRSPNALLYVEEAAVPRIGLRHLKTHASEVLRDVEDNRVRYVVTNRGAPVAVIVPYAPEEEVEPQTRQEAWDQLLALRERMSKKRPEPFSAEELLRDLRR